jgi:hypothetical protein
VYDKLLFVPNVSEAGPACWVFKIVEKPKYPDQHGRTYVYDNTHSVRVKAGDHFVYLKKSHRNDLEFTAEGAIERVDTREAGDGEKRGKATRIFTAWLTDVKEFATPVVISPRKAGDENREIIGFSRNLNDDGLSRSICRVQKAQFDRIVSLAGGALKVRPD